MKGKVILILVLLIVGIFSRFWIGVYEDDEFDEHHVFVKHRPIWKWYFYSPRGMSDMELSEMSEEKRREQVLFDEFVGEWWN